MTTSIPEESGSHIDLTRQRRKAPAVPPAEPRRNPSDPALAMDAGRYQWLLQVGEGGMGQVWKGLDTVLNRTVALKRILPELARIPDLLQRFRTEATSLAQLNHPNVVRIYDFASDDQGPFLVMQWVDGRNLDDVLSAEGPLAPARAALLIAKVAAAMQVAHDARIIHRDIKCANILLIDRNEPLITDFGIAVASGQGGESAGTRSINTRQTQTGQIIGSLEYMPPEQMRDSRSVTAASDIYSLGATLYRLVTGRSPARITTKYVPDGLRDILEKATEERPADRYASMQQFAVALRQASKTLSNQPAQTSAKPGSGRTNVGKPLPTTPGRPAATRTSSVSGTVAGRKNPPPTPKPHPATPPASGHTQAGSNRQSPQPPATLPLSRRQFWLGAGTLAVLAGAKSVYDRIQEIETAAIVNPESEPPVPEITIDPAQNSGPAETTVTELEPVITEPQPAPAQEPQVAGPAWLKAPFDRQTAVAAQEAWAKHLGIDVEVTNSLGMKFRIIPPGEFLMGSPASETKPPETDDFHQMMRQQQLWERDQAEEHQHLVRITKPKLFGVYPVTQAEFRTVMGSNCSYFQGQIASGADTDRLPGVGRRGPRAGSGKRASAGDTDRFPVDSLVSMYLDQSVEYLWRLNSKYAIPGWKYRLPTEAEWEYACRAGTTTPFWFGSELNGSQANCDGSRPFGTTDKGPEPGMPSVVGSYPPNPFGLCDMHGNVWEPCQDLYDSNFYAQSPTDDPCSTRGEQFTNGSTVNSLRGGSWKSSASDCRSAARSGRLSWGGEGVRYEIPFTDVGIRLVCEMV